MDLVLTLTNGDQLVQDRQRRLQGGRLSIGRAADNDWILPDPARLLSKRHCVIEQRDGDWLLTDTSANGVFVADALEPLGEGRSVRLRDGLRLSLGDYVLSVRLAAENGMPEAVVAPPSAIPAEAADSQLFDWTWARDKPLDRAGHHPSATSPGALTRADHAPPHQVALDLPRRPPPFDDVPLPPSPSGPDEPGIPRAAAREESIPAPPAAPPEAAPEQAPQAQAGEPCDAASGLAAFLEGAGLTRADAGEAAPGALLRDLGQRYRMMAQGLIELLMIRTALKRETGLDRTMIEAADNNPLKLTATAEEAVRWLVSPRGAGYLPPDPAIAATIDDLKAFTPELVRSMQQGLQALLHQFDPNALERTLANVSLLEIVAAGGRRATYWQRFKDRYGELAQRAEGEFLRQVGLDTGRMRHLTPPQGHAR